MGAEPMTNRPSYPQWINPLTGKAIPHWVWCPTSNDWMNVWQLQNDVVGKLPISAKRREIIDVIKENRVTLLNAETGSGKTTQVPKYVADVHMELYGHAGTTFVVLPMRMQAMEAAQCVALELGLHLGKEICVRVGGQMSVGDPWKASLVFCVQQCFIDLIAEGILHHMKEVTLIFDEVDHDTCQRSILQALSFSGPAHHLRLVLMSATLETAKLMRFYGTYNPASLLIEGLMYPVHCFTAEETINMSDAELLSLGFEVAVQEVQDYGVTILFVKGEPEILAVMENLDGKENLRVLPYHGALDFDEKIVSNFFIEAVSILKM